jgi:hypothetical protein
MLLFEYFAFAGLPTASPLHGVVTCNRSLALLITSANAQQHPRISVGHKTQQRLYCTAPQPLPYK